jgi:hypothetical protein
VRIPLRYRAALRAYPAGYRATRGAELLATLAEGDDDRGRPSGREAAVLAGRGLMMRAGVAVAPQGLLAAAAALILAAAMAPASMWADDTVRLGPGALYFGWDAAPSVWWRLALCVSGLVVLAAGPARAVESPRRRTVAVLMALPLAVGVFGALGRIFAAGAPDVASIGDVLWWLGHVAVDEWALLASLSAAAVVVTWIALRLLARLSGPARRRVLAGALALPAAVTVMQAWSRPADPGRIGIYEGEYVEGQFAALGPGTFLALAGLIFALAASLRTWRRS